MGKTKTKTILLNMQKLVLGLLATSTLGIKVQKHGKWGKMRSP